METIAVNHSQISLQENLNHQTPNKIQITETKQLGTYDIQKILDD